MVRSKNYRKKGGDDVINTDNTPGILDKIKNMFKTDDNSTKTDNSNSPGFFDKIKNMFTQKTYEADKGVTGALGSAKDTGLSMFEQIKQKLTFNKTQQAGSKKRRNNLTKKNHKRKRT